MLILSVETATMRTGVAIGSGEGVVASFHVAHKQRHAETLAPAIEFVCAQARIGLDDIECIAVDIGPGLFTGLRVGVATVKAIAHARQIPVAPVLSLDALAFAARRTGRRIVTIIDALQDQVFYATYEGGWDGVQRVDEHCVVNADEVADRILAINAECLIVGDAVVRLPESLRANPRIHIGGPDLKHPSADALVQLAAPMAERGQLLPQSEVSITYLRDAYIHPKRRDAPATPRA